MSYYVSLIYELLCAIMTYELLLWQAIVCSLLAVLNAASIFKFGFTTVHMSVPVSTHMAVHIYTYVYVYPHISAHTIAHAFSHVYTHVSIHLYAHLYTHVHAHVCAYFHAHVYAHVYTHVYTHNNKGPRCPEGQRQSLAGRFTSSDKLL